ncbi:protein phosphatase 2C domain-containing protein [candidate division KSB1 bacterium]|nr:protein phosphatase 2C domain-containing protein [candidate division KSB1 bacterium]
MAESRKVLSLEVGKLTDTGRFRQHAFDSLGFFKPTTPELLYQKGELFMVADGMGGQDLGVRAARMATDIIIKRYFDTPLNNSIEEALLHAFNYANMQIISINEKEAGYVDAGVSATCAVIHRGTLHLAHIGNSRLYLLKGHQMKQMTTDHVTSREAPSSPDWRKSPAKTTLSQALGWEPQIQIEYMSINLRPNDCILLCTDGLYEVLDNREIGNLAIRYSPQDACERLINLANEKGGPDNMTTILIRIAGLMSLPDMLDESTGEEGINLLPDSQKIHSKIHPINRTTIRFNDPGESEDERDTIDESVFEEAEKDELTAEEEFEDEEIKAEAVDEGYDEEKLDEEQLDEEDPTPRRIASPPVPPSGQRISRPDVPKFSRPVSPRSPIDFSPTGFQSNMPGQHGVSRRRREHEAKVPKFDFKQNWPFIVFSAISFLLLILIFWVVIKEDSLFKRPGSGPSYSDSTLIAVDSTGLKPQSSIPSPSITADKIVSEMKPDSVQPRITPVIRPRLVIINGARLSTAVMNNLSGVIQPKLPADSYLQSMSTKAKLTTKSKIIFRYPESGEGKQIRDIAQIIQQAIYQKYRENLEIISSRFTLIIGKDFNISRLDLSNFRREILDTNLRNSIHIEILNGMGTPGLAKKLETRLDNLIIDDENFLKVIDSRNALNFNYNTTTILCRTRDIPLAKKIGEILGIHSSTIKIETENLADIQLIIASGTLIK